MQESVYQERVQSRHLPDDDWDGYAVEIPKSIALAADVLRNYTYFVLTDHGRGARP
jgi:hypothetical protein